MNIAEIEKTIHEIMRRDGPDGHIDGSDVIIDFIISLLLDKGEEWVEEYNRKLNTALKNLINK